MRLTARSILSVLTLLALGCGTEAESLPAKASSPANDPGPASAEQPQNLLSPSTSVIAPTASAKPVSERAATAPSPALPTIDADRSRFTIKGGSSSQAFNRHIERGSRLFNTRKFDDAAKEFEAAVAADPHDARGYYYLGLANLELGKASKSIRHFDMALNLAPKHIDTLLARASAYLREERFRKAQDDCDAVIDQDEKNSQAFALRATCNFQLGEFELACSDATRSLEIGPKSADCYFIRSLAHARLKMFEEARSDFDQAINLGLSDKLSTVAQSYLKAATDSAKACK